MQSLQIAPLKLDLWSPLISRSAFQGHLLLESRGTGGCPRPVTFQTLGLWIACAMLFSWGCSIRRSCVKSITKALQNKDQLASASHPSDLKAGDMSKSSLSRHQMQQSLASFRPACMSFKQLPVQPRRMLTSSHVAFLPMQDSCVIII